MYSNVANTACIFPKDWRQFQLLNTTGSRGAERLPAEGRREQALRSRGHAGSGRCISEGCGVAPRPLRVAGKSAVWNSKAQIDAKGRHALKPSPVMSDLNSDSRKTSIICSPRVIRTKERIRDLGGRHGLAQALLGTTHTTRHPEAKSLVQALSANLAAALLKLD